MYTLENEDNGSGEVLSKYFTYVGEVLAKKA